MRIAFLGLGLIGGSVARALARVRDEATTGGPISLVAWSPSGDGPRRAVADGVLDDAAFEPAAALGGADLVVLAGPPLGVLEWLDELGGPLAPHLSRDATITDVASTKSAIVGRADAHGLPFVGGHPMAGRETSGYGAASADLFHDRPWVVVRGAAARDGDVTRVEWLARTCGARPLPMAAAAHDAATAAISHLPLVVSVALVEAVVGEADRPDRADWAVAAGLAASGWRDATRLARGDAAMAAGIAATNATALAGRLHDLRVAVDAWLVELERAEGPDARRLEERFRAARDRLEGNR